MAKATLLDTQDNLIDGYLELVPQGKYNLEIEVLLQLTKPEADELGEAEVQVLEGVRYEYELSNPTWKLSAASWGAGTDVVIESKFPSRRHCGVLNPGLATGTLSLKVLDQEDHLVGSTKVEVRSRKLGYRTDYQLMLNDITSHCVSLLQDWQAASQFKAVPNPGEDEATIGQRFAFVHALLNAPSFDHALQRITTHPHEAWTQEESSHPAARGVKPTGKLLRQLAAGTRRMAVPSHHSLYGVLPTLPERITAHQNTRTTDTPENRFVKFALRSFQQFLGDAGNKQAIQSQKHQRLRSELQALSDKLDQVLGCDAMRHTGEPTFLPLGSPTLQRREGYRQVLQAWMSFAVAAKLVWEGGEKVYGMGQRDVAALYEYWVFFELLQTVKSIFNFEMPDLKNLIEPTEDGFGLKLKAGQHFPISGTSKQPGRELEVRFSYNRSFRGSKYTRIAGSWTKTMRPDYTLSMWPVGFTDTQAEQQELMVHVHFDAKYRLEQAADLLSSPNLDGADGDGFENTEQDEIKQAEATGTYKRADLLKMHAYRDAIRRSHGAYVLYPGHKQVGESFKGFHEVLPGLGAFAIRPGQGTHELQHFLRDVVNHVCDRTTARERHSYETFKSYEISRPLLTEDARPPYGVISEKTFSGNRHTPPSDTAVLIGWVKSEKHLDWIKQVGLYNFRLDHRPGALQLTTKIVGAQYILLHGGDRGVKPSLYRVSSSNQGPVFSDKDFLMSKGYPTTPTRDAYILFSIEPINEFKDYAWDIQLIPDLPQEVKDGFPFATDLATLLATCK